MAKIRLEFLSYVSLGPKFSPQPLLHHHRNLLQAVSMWRREDQIAIRPGVVFHHRVQIGRRYKLTGPLTLYKDFFPLGHHHRWTDVQRLNWSLLHKKPTCASEIHKSVVLDVVSRVLAVTPVCATMVTG